MPTRKVRTGSYISIHQSRVVRQDLVRLLTVPDPKLLRRFLIPVQ